MVLYLLPPGTVAHFTGLPASFLPPHTTFGSPAYLLPAYTYTYLLPSLPSQPLPTPYTYPCYQGGNLLALFCLVPFALHDHPHRCHCHLRTRLIPPYLLLAGQLLLHAERAVPRVCAGRTLCPARRRPGAAMAGDYGQKTGGACSSACHSLPHHAALLSLLAIPLTMLATLCLLLWAERLRMRRGGQAAWPMLYAGRRPVRCSPRVRLLRLQRQHRSASR